MLNQINGLLKALADENRLRIVAALGRGPQCVCRLVDMLDLSQSTVSKHLSILKQAQVVDSWKDRTWVHYKLKKNEPMINKMVKSLTAALADDKQIAKDRRFVIKSAKRPCVVE